MNVLIAGLLQSFCEKFEYDPVPEHKAFELLAVHSLYTPDLPDSFSLDDTMAGDETVGFDSIAIFANGDLITDLDEANAAVDQGKPIDLSCFFLEAKTSSKFEREPILGFGQAVRQFFAASPALEESAMVADRRAAKDAFYASSALFRNRLPVLRLYYVTTGTLHPEDANIIGAARTEQDALLGTGLFEDVQIKLVGASDLHKAFVAATNRVEATLNFQRRVALPKIPGVDQAFIGVLPATEFIKLISTGDGEIRKSVFYDNVRDFQQWNAVNDDIWETLTSPEADLFPVLNNGVTVVAQKVRAVADDVTVEDFQIVNGCQTSHVIFAAHTQDKIKSSVLVPMRLIVTEDELVASKITKATNNQTPIEEADLVALTDFQKELEAHYRGYADKQRLYYDA